MEQPPRPSRRIGPGPDRRRVPRGGRRTTDRPGNYPTLLVADSYERARVHCVRCLHQNNFQVVHTADGDEALALIHAVSPHVILTEVGLPAMPAWRLSQWIAQSPRRIPIIVMVDDSDKDAIGRMRQPPAAVLVKPFSAQAMLDAVRRVLRAGRVVNQPAES